MSDSLYLIVESFIPLWADIHVVIHEENVVGCDKCTQLIQGIANPDVLFRMGIVEALLFYPIQGAIRSFIDVGMRIENNF